MEGAGALAAAGDDGDDIGNASRRSSTRTAMAYSLSLIHIFRAGGRQKVRMRARQHAAAALALHAGALPLAHAQKGAGKQPGKRALSGTGNTGEDVYKRQPLAVRAENGIFIGPQLLLRIGIGAPLGLCIKQRGGQPQLPCAVILLLAL